MVGEKMYKGKSINTIVQARMGSTRLPGKVLKNLGDKKVLDHVVDRLGKSKFIDKIIVATSTNSQDDAIEKWGGDRDVIVFRGSEENVLKRFYDCSKKYPSDVICRVTADCPLVSYNLIDNCIRVLIDEDCDYVRINNNIIPRGLYGTVFPSEVLEEVYQKAYKKSHKEHVTYYIYEDNEDEFKIKNLQPPKWLIKDYRLTLDTEEDYRLLKEVFEQVPSSDSSGFISVESVIKFLDDNPSIANINKCVNQKPIE